MTYRKLLTASALVAAGALIGPVQAQQEPAQGIPVLQLTHVVDVGPVEARILEMHPATRTLTVRLDSTKEKAMLIVPEDADIVRTFPNDIERNIDLNQLDPGDNIMVEGAEVDGVIQLRIVGGAA